MQRKVTLVVKNNEKVYNGAGFIINKKKILERSARACLKIIPATCTPQFAVYFAFIQLT